jgi:hypothetical protein
MDTILSDQVKKLSLEDRGWFEERAAIMEYDGKMSREESEKEAYRCLLQITHKPKKKGDPPIDDRPKGII